MVFNNQAKESEATVKLFQTWIDTVSNQDETKVNSAGTSANTHKNEKTQTLTFENVRIDFPLRPYPAQVQMMKKIVHTLNESENALLESPTGSGKSLALLCSVLAWRENEEKKVAAEIKSESKKDVKIESKKILEEIQAKNVPIQVETIDVDMKPVIESKKREIDENDPSNWRKKFKCSNSVITIDEDSFEDFQTSGMDSKTKVKDENVPPQKSDMEQVNSLKYQTFQKVPRIFVGSRTHKQISQLVSELKTKTRYNPRTTILGSREQLCIHPKVSKMANKTEGCVDLLDKGGCSFGQKAHSIITHPTLKNTNRIWDIEDLVTIGKKVRGCPYYASRKIYESAEVVFCPYNYIIDPIIRKILDINLKGSIIILDEAHNIEDSSRSAGSFEVDERKLSIIKRELDQVIRNGYEAEAHQNLEVIIDYLFDWITSTDNVYTIQEYEAHHCHWTGIKIINKLADGSITPFIFNEKLKPAYKKVASHAEEIRKDKENKTKEDEEYDGSTSQAQYHRRKCLSNNSLTVLQGIFMVLGFLFQEGKNFEEDYQMVLTKKIERVTKTPPNKGKRKKNIGSYMEPEWSFKLAFKCLNPAIIFKDMTETTRSVILTSGTLSPLNTFASELDTKFEGRLEANHVIDKSQVWVGGIPQGPNRVALKGIYTNWESFQYQDDLGEALCEIVESVPFGVLCFLPSYNTLDKLLQRWKLTKLHDRLAARKMIFSEPRGSDKADFEGTIGAFYRQIDKVELEPDNEGRDGALFFAVFRGKVSEGIDFTDNYCRAVVAIGIPFPAVKDIEVKFKKEYNDKKRIRTRNVNLLTSNQWYTAQAFRAINQALGRCIRHKNDWGAIILLEDRFQNSENVNQLSKWVRNQFKMHPNFPSAITDLNGFVQRQLERTAIPVSEPTIVSLSEIFLESSNEPLPAVDTADGHTFDIPMVDVSTVNTSIIGTPAVNIIPGTDSSIFPLNDSTLNTTIANTYDVDALNTFNIPKTTTVITSTANTLTENTPMANTPTAYTSITETRTENVSTYFESAFDKPSTVSPVKTTSSFTSSAVKHSIVSPQLPSIKLEEDPLQKTGLSLLMHPQTTLLPTTDSVVIQPSITNILAASLSTTSSSKIPYSSSLHSSTPYASPLRSSIPLPYQPKVSNVMSPLKLTSVNSFQNEDNNISDEDDIVVLKTTPNLLKHPKDACEPRPHNFNEHLDVPIQKGTHIPERQEAAVQQKTSTPVVFKVPDPAAVNLERKDFFSIRNDDQSRVRITCSCCERLLLEGPTRDILPVTIRDLALITKNSTMDNSNMVEIHEPGKWDTNVDFVGGPIDIRKWPNESTVTLNADDGICYRSLHCLCPISKSQGVVIRQSFGHRNSKYDGKVFLWLTQLRIRKNFTKDNHSHISYQPEDSIEIASSQIPSMNDMFYDL